MVTSSLGVQTDRQTDRHTDGYVQDIFMALMGLAMASVDFPLALSRPSGL